MKILITGASGMVGRNLCQVFEQKDIQILAPKSADLNLLDFQQTCDYLDEYRPDGIIHCAGKVGGIQANVQYPVAFLCDNWEMGKNLLRAAERSEIKKIFNLGSSCMYPKDREIPLTEEMILDGKLEPTNEGYALAKISVAKLGEFISKENPNINVKTILPCNLYGLYDHFSPDRSHLLAAIIAKIHEAKTKGLEKVEIWGDGKSRREFLYVRDLAEAVSLAWDQFDAIDPFMNIGFGSDHTILEYYESVAKVIGFSGTFTHNLDKPTGMKRKLVDSTKIFNLGWAPRTSLEKGIKLTYQHYIAEVLHGKI